MASPSPIPGVDRKEIPWYPTIDEELCTGCGECQEFCDNDVFEMEEEVMIVKNPYNCVVGCSTCEKFCPNDALSFPSKEELTKIMKELRERQKKK